MLFISILTLITVKAVKSFNIDHIHFTRLSSLILIYAAALIINVCYIQSIGSGIGIYNGYFHVTYLNLFIESFIFIIGSIILLSWPYITNNQSKLSTDYSLIILFSILGSSLLISSFDLISIFLSIELQSFGLYVLATLYKNSESSTSAGLKYFLLGAFSSCLILLGSGIIYSYSGITNLESLYIFNSVNSIILTPIDASHLTLAGFPLISNYSLNGIYLGLIILTIGFLFKIAAAPLHNWSPDVYDGVPTIVTTWLTIIPKIAILILLLDLQINIFGESIINYISPYVDGGINNVLKNIFLISSLLSLIIGSLLGLAQIKIKRLLAYSTISHLGFILLAMAINTEQSIDSFIFYLLQYTLTNLNIFLIILALSYKIKRNNINSYNNNNDINYISEFNGLFNSNPLLCISLAVCLFSMAGIPPLLGFFSKQFVLYSALQNGYYFMSIVAIIVSVISASYYLQIIKNIYNIDTAIDNNINISNINNNNNNTSLSNIQSYLISLLTIFIVFFFINPTILLNSSKLLALSLFYN